MLKKNIQKFILINKKEGETPLECLEHFRNKNKEYKNVKMTYAGRLDPMASGLLLILVGEEIKNKEKYLKLNKVYDFEILFGFATDTYDILGKPARTTVQSGGVVGEGGGKREEIERLIAKNLKYFKGKIVQKIPAYSTTTWEEARSGKKFKQKKRKVVVYTLDFSALKSITSQKLLQNIEKRIKKVKGDFRQEEILKIWKKYLKNNNKYFIGEFTAQVSSGTYIRSIANDLGSKIKVPSLAFRIKRTKVGKMTLAG